MHRRRWWTRAAWLGLAWLVLPGSVMAGPAGTQGGDFIYEVEPGDTLIGLAARYMASPDDWRLLQSRNQVADPYRLVPGSRIRMPLSRIPVKAATARVVFARGQVSADGRPVQVGVQLGEATRIDTGADGAITLELPDGTRVALPAGTSVQVRRLRTFARSGLTDTVIGIEQGAAESRVAPRGGGVGRYEIRTPAMVTGVRGTRYRVTADGAGSRSEVIEGTVGVGTPATAQQAVGAGFGLGVSAQGHLGQPVALLPAPQVVNVAQPVTVASLIVRWSVVPGAVAYRVGVARDAALTEWVSSGEVTAPEAMLNGLPDGALHVVVQAIAADRLVGHAGVLPITVKRNPPAPFSLAPQPDGTAYGGEASFRWAAVPDAVAYDIAIAADAGFATQARTWREDGVEAQRNLAVGQWWWRLRSVDARGEPGPWGDTAALRMDPAAPVPAAADGGGNLRVRWPEAADAHDGYVLQMAGNARFSEDLLTLRAARNELSVPRPASGTYYVRVACARGKGLPPDAAFSAPQRIDLPPVLRDGQGSVVLLGGASHGVQIGTR